MTFYNKPLVRTPQGKLVTNCCTWGYVGAGENKTACSAAELGHERRRRKRKRLNWTSSATKFSGRRLYAVLYRRLMTEVQGIVRGTLHRCLVRVGSIQLRITSWRYYHPS
ncbi:hypothetical protein Plhal304r1_c076g0163331 [Plasmopara halstedii]